MVLPEEDAKRRIAAARLLRNLSQKKLDELGADDGLGRQELSRTERGELPLTRVRREVLARHLRLPAEWFLAAEIDALIRWPAEGLPDEQVRRAAELLAPQLLEAALALQQASDTARSTPAALDRPPANGGGGGG